jgi:hypothetical protein
MAAFDESLATFALTAGKPSRSEFTHNINAWQDPKRLIAKAISGTTVQYICSNPDCKWSVTASLRGNPLEYQIKTDAPDTCTIHTCPDVDVPNVRSGSKGTPTAGKNKSSKSGKTKAAQSEKSDGKEKPRNDKAAASSHKDSKGLVSSPEAGDEAATVAAAEMLSSMQHQRTHHLIDINPVIRETVAGNPESIDKVEKSSSKKRKHESSVDVLKGAAVAVAATSGAGPNDIIVEKSNVSIQSMESIAAAAKIRRVLLDEIKLTEIEMMRMEVSSNFNPHGANYGRLQKHLKTVERDFDTII